jgi:hypothetical protein
LAEEKTAQSQFLSKMGGIALAIGPYVIILGVGWFALSRLGGLLSGGLGSMTSLKVGDKVQGPGFGFFGSKGVFNTIATGGKNHIKNIADFDEVPLTAEEKTALQSYDAAYSATVGSYPGVNQYKVEPGNGNYFVDWPDGFAVEAPIEVNQFQGHLQDAWNNRHVKPFDRETTTGEIAYWFNELDEFAAQKKPGRLGFDERYQAPKAGAEEARIFASYGFKSPRTPMGIFMGAVTTVAGMDFTEAAERFGPINWNLNAAMTDQARTYFGWAQSYSYNNYGKSLKRSLQARKS